MLVVLPISAPGVDAARLISTGASELRSTFTLEELPGITVAYMHGLKAVFALLIGFSGIAFLATLAIPWRRLPTHTPNAEGNATPAIMPA